MKRKDRFIRIVSNPVITSQVMMEIGDEYRNIHSYFPVIESQVEDKVRKKPLKKGELEILRKGAVIGLLVAIQAIVEAGNKPGTEHVKHVIQSLNPEFSEDKLGFSGWIDFLSWAENEEKLVEQVGSLPGTILRIPDELINSSQSLIGARCHGFERLVQTVEEFMHMHDLTTEKAASKAIALVKEHAKATTKGWPALGSRERYHVRDQGMSEKRAQLNACRWCAGLVDAYHPSVFEDLI